MVSGYRQTFYCHLRYFDYLYTCNKNVLLLPYYIWTYIYTSENFYPGYIPNIWKIFMWLNTLVINVNFILFKNKNKRTKITHTVTCKSVPIVTFETSTVVWANDVDTLSPNWTRRGLAFVDIYKFKLGYIRTFPFY